MAIATIPLILAPGFVLTPLPYKNQNFSRNPIRIVATAYRLTSAQESAHNLIIK